MTFCHNEDWLQYASVIHYQGSLACLCHLRDSQLDRKSVAVHVQALQFSGPVDDVGSAGVIVSPQEAVMHLAVRWRHQH